MIPFAALAAAILLATPSFPPPGVVNGHSAQQLVAAGAAVLDVRTPAEFEAGHIPGAKLLPYDQVAARAGELPGKDRPILLYCRTGRRTAIAAGALARLGYTRVYDLQGLSNWTGPVEAGPSR
jgi:phage shock protein E